MFELLSLNHKLEVIDKYRKTLENDVERLRNDNDKLKDDYIKVQETLNEQLKEALGKLDENENQKDNQNKIKKLNNDLDLALDRKAYYKEKFLDKEEKLRTTVETLREKELSLIIAVEGNTELRKDYKELHENFNSSRD